MREILKTEQYRSLPLLCNDSLRGFLKNANVLPKNKYLFIQLKRTCYEVNWKYNISFTIYENMMLFGINIINAR